MEDVRNNWRWRSLRTPIASEETALADLGPARLTAALQAKMACVSPAKAIVIRGFGQGGDGKVADTVIISGWAFSGDSLSAGQTLWIGSATLGNNAWAAAGRPLPDPKWESAQWQEVDTWATTTDFVKPALINSTNRQSCLILPTLGYTHILAELCKTTTWDMTKFGLIWRPLGNSDVLLPAGLWS